MKDLSGGLSCSLIVLKFLSYESFLLRVARFNSTGSYYIMGDEWGKNINAFLACRLTLVLRPVQAAEIFLFICDRNKAMTIYVQYLVTTLSPKCGCAGSMLFTTSGKRCVKSVNIDWIVIALFRSQIMREISAASTGLGT